MECRTAEVLLHGYLDGELELLGSYEFEQHIEECPLCAERLAKERALRRRFAGTSLRFRAPSELRARIQAALPERGPVPVAAPPRRTPWGFWVPAAAAVVLLAIFVGRGPAPSAETLLAQQIRDGHVRSLLAGHLKDIDSSDQHTVKPWFAGRLDFAPWTADLADEGFPLQGGRLDYIDNRRVAALVFKRREHEINLFLWPAADAAAHGVRLVHESNYQLVYWTAAGMTWWAVSDLNAAELQEFAALVRARAERPVEAP
jgi:anti-sigma factor RsiW